VAASADPENAELHYEAALALAGEPLPELNPVANAAQHRALSTQHSSEATPAATDLAEALRHLAAALQRNPRHALAFCAVARLQHERRGDWRGATRAYGQALKLDRELPEASLGLARALAHLDMPAEVAYHQARALRLRGQPDAAIPRFRRWGELRPERWESPLRVAECQMEMGRDREAATTLEAALRRFPGQTSLYLLLGQLYLRTLAQNDAARIAGEWQARAPEDPWPYWLRGSVALSAGRVDEARSALETALAKRPGEPILQLALADALAREPTPERLQRARELLEAAEAADPQKPTYPSQLATVLLNLNEPDSALAAHLRALRLDPRSRSAYGSVSQLAQRMGHAAAASFFAELGRSLRREGAALRLATSRLWDAPTNPERRLEVARLLLARGDLEHAADHLAVAARSGHAEARSLLQRVQRLRAVLPSR
jgi:tetratricopeptide (TPR) repeat protein